MQGDAILAGEAQEENTRFYFNIPLITLEIHAQNLEGSLHSQKQWKHVPLF